jgi:hypothetical protein
MTMAIDQRVGPHSDEEWEEIEEAATEKAVAAVVRIAEEAASFDDQIAPGAVGNIVEEVIFELVKLLRDV